MEKKFHRWSVNGQWVKLLSSDKLVSLVSEISWFIEDFHTFVNDERPTILTRSGKEVYISYLARLGPLRGQFVTELSRRSKSSPVKLWNASELERK